MKQSKLFFTMILLAFIISCTAVRRDYPEPKPSSARDPGEQGPLAEVEFAFAQKHGTRKSGFLLLDNNQESLNWRLTLIDEARYSLDVQYYLWYGDDSGSLVFKKIIDAAERGVKVRLIADGLLFVGQGETLAAIDSHPNIEVRIFNPWEQQRRRSKKTLQTVERFNFRTHNKILTADNRLAILGGRNLGNDYFGLHHVYNFLDIDVLSVGPVTRMVSDIFDHFWNSQWVIPGYAYTEVVPEGVLEEVVQHEIEAIQKSERLQNFPAERKNWSGRLNSLPERLHPGVGSTVYDFLEDDDILQRMATELPEFTKSAQKEVLVNNAYLIPDEEMLAESRKIVERGVKMRIITNSLASQDVPAVNSHYGPYRMPILQAGIELYELRSDAAVHKQADTPPIVSGFVGLHAKASVVDRSRVFIGSYNLDPRSRETNTEMGVLIDSPGLGEELARKIEELMEPENSWQVKLDDKGDLIWVAGDEMLKRQPARNFWQRVQDTFFKLFPKDYF